MRSIVYNQFRKELHIITATPWISSTALPLYVIRRKTECNCNFSCVCNQCEGLQEYTFGDDIHAPRDYIRLTAITYQSFGLDKKINLQKQVYFLAVTNNLDATYILKNKCHFFLILIYYFLKILAPRSGLVNIAVY